VQLVQWHTDTDTFVDGQWFHGYLYERRCSLSPDGKLFAYFAAKYSLRLKDSASSETWTAISRPPYFTALALCPKGDAWNGGGVFQENRMLLLNHPNDSKPLVDPAQHLRVLAGYDLAWFTHDEDRSIHSAILQQQGWQPVQASPYAAAPEEVHQQLPILPKGRGRSRFLSKTAIIWQKALAGANGRYVLQQANYGADFNQVGNFNIIQWKLIDRQTKQAHLIEQAEWADWGPNGRLLFTRQGQVWASLPERFPQEATVLLDLNARRPNAKPSPAWARHWPPLT
jgi:hypothetical protein